MIKYKFTIDEYGYVIGYIKNPANDNRYTLSFEDDFKLPNGISKGWYKIINNALVKQDTQSPSLTLSAEEQEKLRLLELRNKREPLLKAFDIYKSNVNYGVIEETEEEHNKITTWYRALLDLDEEAINNVPKSIQKYL